MYNKCKIIFLILIIFTVLMIFYAILWKTMVEPEDDARGYLREALNLLHHHYVTSIERPPEYPTFLALVFSISGEQNFKMLLIAHLLIRLITTTYIVFIILNTTNNIFLTLTSLFLLWTPAFMSQTRYIYTETLSAFLCTISVYTYIRAFKSNYEVIFLLISSLSNATLALTRPVYTILIPIWWMIIFVYKILSRKFMHIWMYRTLIFCVVPFTSIVLGWCIRNYYVNGFFGLNALIGFNLTTRTVSVL